MFFVFLVGFFNSFFNHDEHDSKVDTNLKADLSTTEKEQVDIRQLRVRTTRNELRGNENLKQLKDDTSTYGLTSWSFIYLASPNLNTHTDLYT